MSLPRRLFAVAGVFALLAGISACTPTVSLEPGPQAGDPLCAELMTNLPSPLAGKDRVWTDAQSTAAWGNPTAILMTCGVTPPVVSALPCQSIAGIDWLVDESEKPWYRVTSYGRQPAIQAYINTTEYVDPSEVLQRLAKTMTNFPLTAKCIDRPAS